ncbi:MAG TPA: alkaline phosphatase family protein [Pyrinomonadaceae bacterium]|nr:alkaline phosphatase family protein [Pyrinomonadaceae bacterium]
MAQTHSPRRPRAKAYLLLAALLLALAPAGGAMQRRSARPRPEARPAAPEQQKRARPRLVLLIAVDQFRYDYLERFGDLFVAGGLRRLLRDGASWTNANYDHVPTETAPGHATMMTGAWPAETGIVANDWYERNDKGDGGRRVNNVEDPDAKLLGGGGEKERAATPRRLLASTLGDELRLATNHRSKVIGVSLKDRSAILPAGRHASAAYWYSADTGRMVSTDYYFARMPAWAEAFNAARPAEKYLGRAWERLLPNEAEYLRRAGPDDPEWEWKPAKADRSSSLFPHMLPAAAGDTYFEQLQSTPFASDLLVAFAKEAIASESLGADDDTDVLTVSFSSNDFVGHRFGPYSQEVMDITLRTDGQVAELLDFVDRRVGLANTLVAFTADHGVAPVPEHAAGLNLPGRRVSQSDVRARVKEGLNERFRRAGDTRDRGDDYFLEYTAKNGNVYFNLEALRRDGVPREEAERAACDGALRVRGVARCFTRTQLERGAVSPADPVARRALHGFNPRRSGDIVLVMEAFNLVVTYTADHFAPYSYDTHVPVIIMGAGVAPGRYANPATPADIAPTLARLVGVQAPSNAVGRVLLEAIR